MKEWSNGNNFKAERCAVDYFYGDIAAIFVNPNILLFLAVYLKSMNLKIRQNQKNQIRQFGISTRYHFK